MRAAVLFLVCPLAVSAINILLTNDEGWAGKNIRTFYDALTSSGHSVIISAPAEDRSASGKLSYLGCYKLINLPSTTGSRDVEPRRVSSGCEFGSCPRGSPPTGWNSSNPRLHYVNSYPVTAVKYGINTVAQTIFGGDPELVVSGPNVGKNVGSFPIKFSGTVGAAAYAAKEFGIPAIAFSGRSGEKIAWNADTPEYSETYAGIATAITNALIQGGKPYLPPGVFLNVNFPRYDDERSRKCNYQFNATLTRIHDPWLYEPKDITPCGAKHTPHLPYEKVVIQDGCWVPISVGDAETKSDSSKANQAEVNNKLRSILQCYPHEGSDGWP